MMGAALIEQKMGIGDSERVSRLENILKKLQVPTRIPVSLDSNKLIEALKRDKKAVNQWPKFVLVDRIGRVFCDNGQWAVDAERKLVEQVLSELYEG